MKKQITKQNNNKFGRIRCPVHPYGEIVTQLIFECSIISIVLIFVPIVGKQRHLIGETRVMLPLLDNIV